MHSPTPTLTYFAIVQNQNGTERRISITLPHISCIADLPRYTAPPEPEPEPPVPKALRAPRWSEKVIRRMLGKDRKHTRKLVNGLRYAATMRRIDREGA